MTELERAARAFLAHHSGHHPIKCIGGCDPKACGEKALADALRACVEQRTAAQRDLLGAGH